MTMWSRATPFIVRTPRLSIRTLHILQWMFISGPPVTENVSGRPPRQVDRHYKTLIHSHGGAILLL